MKIAQWLTIPRFLGALHVKALSVSFPAIDEEVVVRLNGEMQVPSAAKTMATGSGIIIVNADLSVEGGVTTNGVAATMAHIHQGAVGVNGPVVIGLSKCCDNDWMVPAGAKLTEEQYRAYKAGDLYVNVYSAQFKDGEIRGQIKPIMQFRHASYDWLLAMLVVGLYFLTATLTEAAQVAGDPVKGKELHDSQCTSCHIDRLGGDGSAIYLRRNRLINDVNALRQRVAMCASQINAGWFPDDEENVTAYLVKRYYMFR